MKTETDRIVFLDYLRFIACFMVVMVHVCEFYYCTDHGVIIDDETARIGVSLIDGAFRQAVPLFVMASSYLLVPLASDTRTRHSPGWNVIVSRLHHSGSTHLPAPRPAIACPSGLSPCLNGRIIRRLSGLPAALSLPSFFHGLTAHQNTEML